MSIARRIKRLGTETAFAVSREASEFALKGNKVFPFHIGDLNIPTPKNIVDAAFRAVREGKTTYCPSAGIDPLREALARDINSTHSTRYKMENVVIQPGGKPVIGKFILSLMNPGDQVLYPSPGYPIYESLIEFYGGIPLPYRYREGKEGFKLDLEYLKSIIGPSTRLLIFNDFQNPMAAEASADELKELAELVKRYDLYVLCDEAYFDIRYGGSSNSLASLEGMESRCVILYTFSKKFAMTGWRLGAAVAPEPVARTIAKLNTNNESCPNHFVQYGGLEGLRGSSRETDNIINILRRRRDRAVEILNSVKGVRCFNPETTFYLFPNVSEAMKRKGFDSYERFRKEVLLRTGVSFCTRLHFGREIKGEKEKYIRFAYSGIGIEDLTRGLNCFKEFIEH